MEKLPEEIFRKHIFVFLNPEDIFNLGECSSQMKDIVLNNLTHPLGTHLQYLKTRKQLFEKLPSVYDEINMFKYSELCAKSDCSCILFHKRKNCVVLDPVFCEKCQRMYLCMYHDILLAVMLNIALCQECARNKTYCEECSIELNK